MRVGVRSVQVLPLVQIMGAHTQCAGAAPDVVQVDGSVAQWNVGGEEQKFGASGTMMLPGGHRPASSGS
jgi:hypothetical protein